MRAASRQISPYASCTHSPVVTGNIPAVPGGRGLRDAHAEQWFPELAENVSRFTAPFTSEARSVTRENHAPIGVRSQKPSRQVFAAQFAFAMPRRHRHDQPTDSIHSRQRVKDRLIKLY